MTAYLSRIAARFNGPSGSTITPSAPAFGSPNPAGNDFPFLSAPQPLAESEFPMYPATNQVAESRSKVLNPVPPQLEVSSFETIRTLFHSDLFKMEEDTVVRPAKVSEERIEPEATVRSVEHRPILEKGIVPEDQQHIKDYPPVPGAIDAQLPAKKNKVVFSPQVQNVKRAKPEIRPTETSEVKLNPESSTFEKLKTEEPKKNTIRKEIAGKHINTPGEAILEKRVRTQLRPSNRTRINKTGQLPKKSKEHKIRIGSIKVEIIPARPKHRTVPQKMPRQTLPPQARSSVNKPRFPLRFGLKQI